MSIIKIEIYELPNGKSPYLGWLTDLDIKIQAIIEKRIARIAWETSEIVKPIQNG